MKKLILSLLVLFALSCTKETEAPQYCWTCEQTKNYPVNGQDNYQHYQTYVIGCDASEDSVRRFEARGNTFNYRMGCTRNE